MTPLSEDRRERAFCGVGVRNNGTGWLFSLSPLLALSMSCARCPTPFAQQHLKLLGPPNSGRSVAEWAPSLKRATDACVLASNNASPAQRGPRRDAQPLHATPLAAVLFPAPLRARAFFFADHSGNFYQLAGELCMKRPARHRSSPMELAPRLNPQAQQHCDAFSTVSYTHLTLPTTEAV